MDSNLSRGLMILKRQTLLRLPRALYLRSGASRTAIGSTSFTSNSQSGSADPVTVETSTNSGASGSSSGGNNGGGGGGISSRRSFLLGRSQADDEQLLHSAAWSPGVQSIASGVSSVHRSSNNIPSSNPSSPVTAQSPHPRRLITTTSAGSRSQYCSSSATQSSTGQTRLSSWLLDSSESQETSIRRSSTDSDRSQMVSNSITSCQLPDDKYHAIYIGLLLCGVGFLLPYNCLVLSSDYFQLKHPHSTIVFDLTLVYILSAFVAVCICSASVRWPSGIIRMRCGALLSLFTMFVVGLMLLYDPLPNDEEDTSIEWSMENVIPKTMHMINASIPIVPFNHSLHSETDTSLPETSSTYHDHDHHHHHHQHHHDSLPFTENPWLYRLTLFSAALLAIGCTLQQSSLYGVAAQLPQRYTHALMTGESAAGLIAALIRFLSRIMMRPVQENTLLFFCLGFHLVCLCFIVQLCIPRSRFYAAHVRHHEQLASGTATRTMISGANTVSGPSSLVNPIYEEENCLTITADGRRTEPVPKSDSTEFELPFGIDEEELRIRLAHGWTGGEAARLGIRTLRRMKQRQEQRLQPDDLTDIFRVRDNEDEDEEDEDDDDDDDEDELFALHLAPGYRNSRTIQNDAERGLDLEDELVFDVGQTFHGRTRTKPKSVSNSNQTTATAQPSSSTPLPPPPPAPPSQLNSPSNRSQMGNTFSNRLINSIVSRCPTVIIERWRQVRLSWQQLLHTMNKRTQLCQRIWPHMISIWLAYAVTLSLFPGIESEIIDCDWRRWTPVVLMAIFNVTDLIGKLLASLCYRINAKQLLWASIGRLVMIPLLVACAGRHSKDSFWNQLSPLASYLSAILGLTNGLLGSLPMILAPGRVPAHQRQLTGNIMTFCYLFGLSFGSVFAYALRAMFVEPLEPSIDLEHYCSTIGRTHPKSD